MLFIDMQTNILLTIYIHILFCTNISNFTMFSHNKKPCYKNKYTPTSSKLNPQLLKSYFTVVNVIYFQIFYKSRWLRPAE